MDTSEAIQKTKNQLRDIRMSHGITDMWEWNTQNKSKIQD
jgi:hypothetical protein